MAIKAAKGRDLLEEERRAQTSMYLATIGEEANEAARGLESADLTSALTKLLTKKTRKLLAEKLIELALQAGERTSLEAIREIYDRIEGRARVSVTNSRAENDPLLKLLADVMGPTPALIAGGKVMQVIEGESRVIIDG